jgi:hypothetical protein
MFRQPPAVNGYVIIVFSKFISLKGGSLCREEMEQGREDRARGQDEVRVRAAEEAVWAATQRDRAEAVSAQAAGIRFLTGPDSRAIR